MQLLLIHLLAKNGMMEEYTIAYHNKQSKKSRLKLLTLKYHLNQGESSFLLISHLFMFYAQL